MTDTTTEAGTERVSASKLIAVPAEKIYAVVSHPAGHVQIDGSGMLIASDDAKPLTEVGETFLIHMDRRPLGDIPDMAEYDVMNTVTKIVPGQAIEWGVGAVGRTPIGHVYGYTLVPVSDTETQVTTYCDWSAISEKWKQRISWPVVPVSMLAESLDKLERVVTSA